MKLDEAQQAKVAEWIKLGSKLSEIQTRLVEELGLKLTYMEVRFLVDDLKLVPVDAEPAKPLELPPQSKAIPPAQPAVPENAPPPLPANAGSGSVSVTVDQIARPGALVSGKVSFSDGQKADWTLDQMGRLGLAAQQKGYRPSATDVEQFQLALQTELSKMGF